MSTDNKQSVTLSDAEIISLAYDCNAMPEAMTDAGLKRFARAIIDVALSKLRVTTSAAFKNLAKGYRHEFEMAEQSARQENSNDAS